MNKAFILMLASFYFCGALFCAAVCNANDCRACRDEPIVALTYPEPYSGEERVGQRVTNDAGPRPIAPPPRWVPVRPAPPRPIGPPPRPVPPPRPRWIWW